MLHLYRFIWHETGSRQLPVAFISVLVAALSMVPLELQRRIVNDAIGGEQLTLLVWLCAAYGGVILVQGGLKYAMRMMSGAIAERVKRRIRRRTLDMFDGGDGSGANGNGEGKGTAMSIVADEVKHVGGFVGDSVSRPIQEGGMMIAIWGYMLVVEPMIALAGLAVFVPQMVAVPKVQAMINERHRRRTEEIREIGGAIDGADQASYGEPPDQTRKRIDHVASLRMQTYRLKHGLKFFVNLLHHLATLAVLGIGGLMAVRGETDVGTIVAFVSGMERVQDPWRGLIAFYREASEAAMRCRQIEDAMKMLNGNGGVR